MFADNFRCSPAASVEMKVTSTAIFDGFDPKAVCVEVGVTTKVKPVRAPAATGNCQSEIANEAITSFVSAEILLMLQGYVEVGPRPRARAL